MDNKKPTFPPVSEKSFSGAILLAFFLGWLGIHRFYVGKVISGTFIFLVPLGKLIIALTLLSLNINVGEPHAYTAGYSEGFLTFLVGLHFIFDILFWAVNIIRFYDIVLLAGHRFTDATGAYLHPTIPENPSEHSYFATLMLARYVGIFGLHRFYVGKPISGFFMAITLGGLGVWWLVDQILIMTQHFWDAEENVVCGN